MVQVEILPRCGHSAPSSLLFRRRYYNLSLHIVVLRLARLANGRAFVRVQETDSAMVLQIFHLHLQFSLKF